MLVSDLQFWKALYSIVETLSPNVTVFRPEPLNAEYLMVTMLSKEIEVRLEQFRKASIPIVAAFSPSVTDVSPVQFLNKSWDRVATNGGSTMLGKAVQPAKA